MSNYKFIRFILNIIIVLFIALFSLFFLYVYQDNKSIETEYEIIDISENQGEIKPVVISENKEEPEILEMEPAVIKEESTNSEDVNNKFYYNQLDEYSKLIYKILEEQTEILKNGNSEINLPKEIGKIVEQSNNIEAVLTIAINAFEYDNPDVFFIDVSKLVMFYEIDRLGNYKIYLKYDNQFNNYLNDGWNNKQDVEKAQEQIDAVVEQIHVAIQGLRTDYEKILYIHDWLVDNVKYDETLSKTNKNNIYGTLVEKEATCGGYAKAFKYLMDKLNINCIIVQGKATSDGRTENHAWNYIDLNGKWYGIDCTWDDPIIIGESTNKKYYTYFLKGNNVFENHKPLEYFYATNLKLEYPNLEINDFR